MRYAAPIKFISPTACYELQGVCQSWPSDGVSFLERREEIWERGDHSTLRTSVKLPIPAALVMYIACWKDTQCLYGAYRRTDQFKFGRLDFSGGIFWRDTSFDHDCNVPVNPSTTTVRRDCSVYASSADAVALGLPANLSGKLFCS